MLSVVERKLYQWFPSLQDQLLWRLLRENIRDQRKYYTIAVLAMVVVAAMTSSVAWIMRYIVDAMTIPDNKGMVMMVALGVVAIFTFKGLATYVQVVALTVRATASSPPSRSSFTTSCSGKACPFSTSPSPPTC